MCAYQIYFNTIGVFKIRKLYFYIRISSKIVIILEYISWLGCSHESQSFPFILSDIALRLSWYNSRIPSKARILTHMYTSYIILYIKWPGASPGSCRKRCGCRRNRSRVRRNSANGGEPQWLPWHRCLSSRRDRMQDQYPQWDQGESGPRSTACARQLSFFIMIIYWICMSLDHASCLVCECDCSCCHHLHSVHKWTDNVFTHSLCTCPDVSETYWSTHYS